MLQVKLTEGHNCQGSQQPMYRHIGASKVTKSANGVAVQPGKGRGTVLGHDPSTSSTRLSIDGTGMRLGAWWLEAAIRGGPELLPVVNTTNTTPAATTKSKKTPGLG